VCVYSVRTVRKAFATEEEQVGTGSSALMQPFANDYARISPVCSSSAPDSLVGHLPDHLCCSSTWNDNSLHFV